MAEHAPRATLRCAPLVLSVLPMLLASAPAFAQQYGQWSWEGTLGGTARSYRNSLDGARTASDDELSADLSLGVDGFLGHPAVGRFRLLGSVGLVSYEGTRRLGSQRWGVDADVRLLPQSRFPLALYAKRQAYSYSHVTEDDPLLLTGLPETTVAFGGRFRMRAGPLNGTLLGYDRSDSAYRAAGGKSALDETAFADWARQWGRFDQHLRLEHRRQDFGLVDYRIRDLTGNFDQVAHLGGGWRWEMFAYGVRRHLDYSGLTSQLDNARTSQHFIDVIGPRATLELSYDGGLTRGAEADFTSHTGLVRLQLRPTPAWTLTPYGGYGLQTARGTRVQAPQGGLSAAWARSKGTFDVVVTEGAGVAWLQTEGGPHDSSLSLSAGATIGQGGDRGLRKEVEVSWARNELRRAGEAIEGLPDLGVGLAGVGTEDNFRGRLTLRRRFGTATSLYAYGEASRREPAGLEGAPAPTVDTLTGTVQLAGRRASLTGNVGTSSVSYPAPQDIRFWAATLALRPLRLLSLQASYRADRRELQLAPDVDAERAEGSVDLVVGAFLLRGQVFQTIETPRDAPERQNRGFVVTLTRRLGGWLPIVTGVPDGGVIR